MSDLEKMPSHTRLYRRNATYYHCSVIVARHGFFQEMTRELWDVDDYVDNHHLRDDMLPIDSEYALSLIEAFLVHHVIDLATEADGMSAELS